MKSQRSSMINVLLTLWSFTCLVDVDRSNVSTVVNGFSANLQYGGRVQKQKKASFMAKTTSSSEQDSIRKVGCGIASNIPSGDRILFDPDEEGKLQGTGEINQRIAMGSSFELLSTESSTGTHHHGSSDATLGQLPVEVDLMDAQHWLEHLDAQGNLPLNFAKPTAPATATLLGRGRIISEDAPGDIQHIVLKLPEGMHYVEGQSLSVIPPGVDAKTGRPHKPRLYSIASTRYGDLLDGNTVSLCVRRAEYYDPNTGLPDPAKKGVCSNFLCDAEPNTQISVAGPVGKTMLLPEDPNTDIIMIATGTGIAPFRAFLHRLFMENTVKRHMFTGTAWLVLGVPTTGGLLYKDEFDAMQTNGKKANKSKQSTFTLN